MTTASTTIADLISCLEEIAPPDLAEDWDNVGLLVGDSQSPVTAVMTCLTLTPDVATEAIERQAQLVVAHHPVLFRPVQRLTTQTIEGRMLLSLIAAGVAVYSPHTSYDSAAAGINQQLAQLLDLSEIQILRPRNNVADDGQGEPSGAGRWGCLPQTLSLQATVELIKQRLQIECLQYAGPAELPITKIGIACGSAAEFLSDAQAQGCQVLLTGEGRFHSALEARSLGMGLILAGHYATERPAVEALAQTLHSRFSDLEVWPSRVETDPIKWA